MIHRFFEEIGEGSVNRSLKERLSGVGIVVDGGQASVDLAAPIGAQKVARVLRIMAVKIADLIGELGITSIAQFCLNGGIGCAVCFWGHQLLVSHHGVLAVGWCPVAWGLAAFRKFTHEISTSGVMHNYPILDD